MATGAVLEMPADTIRLRAAAELMNVSPMSVNRYIRAGRRGRDGRIHRLKFVLVGGMQRTTREWVDQFIAALNTDPDDTSASGRATTPKSPPSGPHHDHAAAEERAVRTKLGM